MTERFSVLWNSDLSGKTDEQLKFRFSIVANPFEPPAEAYAIREELERRGYIFDDRYRDFVTCEEWNKRHGDWFMRDCTKEQI